MMQAGSTVPVPGGFARLASRKDLEDSTPWREAFARRCKDYRYYEILEETLHDGFEHHYVVLEDGTSGFAVVFVMKTVKFLLAVPTMDEVDALLKMLGLIDAALVAGLVVMVMLSSFSSFVENQDDTQNQSWLSAISFGALKFKLASTIAAIGAINLLEAVFETGPLNANDIMLQSGVELVFIGFVFVLAIVDWLEKRSKA